MFPLDAAGNSVPALLERLNRNIQKWCDSHPRPYKLSMSTGSGMLDARDLSKTIADLLAEADQQLYRQKRARPGVR